MSTEYDYVVKVGELSEFKPAELAEGYPVILNGSWVINDALLGRADINIREDGIYASIVMFNELKNRYDLSKLAFSLLKVRGVVCAVNAVAK